MLTGQDTAAIPILLALVEAAKRFGIPAKYAPIVSIIGGIAYGLFTGGLTVEAGLSGLVIGLSASGLYSGGKSVVKTATGN